MGRSRQQATRRDVVRLIGTLLLWMLMCTGSGQRTGECRLKHNNVNCSATIFPVFHIIFFSLFPGVTFDFEATSVSRQSLCTSLAKEGIYLVETAVLFLRLETIFQKF